MLAPCPTSQPRVPANQIRRVLTLNVAQYHWRLMDGDWILYQQAALIPGVTTYPLRVGWVDVRSRAYVAGRPPVYCSQTDSCNEYDGQPHKTLRAAMLEVEFALGLGFTGHI